MHPVHPYIANARAVVFDFYGTLIDDDQTVPTMAAYVRGLGYEATAALEAEHEPNAYDGTLTPRGKAHDAWVEENWLRFLRAAGVMQDEERLVLRRLMNRREQFVIRCADGVPSLLSRLRGRGVKTAVCSNWENDLAPYLSAAGLAGFDALITSRDVGARKPHPKMFREVQRELGFDPEDMVFVGDTWSVDIVGATRAGMRAVWIHGDQPQSRKSERVLQLRRIGDLCSAGS